MLAPGESLSGHLAKLQQQAGGARRATQKPESLTQTMPGPGRSAPGGGTTAVAPPREPWDGARAAREPMPGTVVTQPGGAPAGRIGRQRRGGHQRSGVGPASSDWPPAAARWP